MGELQRLIAEVNEARDRFISAAASLTPRQSHFKPTPDRWSVVENAEHLVRAEQGGIFGMWKAVEGAATGDPVWSGEPVHHGKPIEQVIQETWREREQVPEAAAPIWGGSLEFWIASLRSNRSLLEELGRALEPHRLDALHYPHPISGPLDMRQRHEFLRFHLDRHREQVLHLKHHPEFPVGDS